MLKKLKYKEITWIDLESPTPDEISSLATEYDIHPVALAELVNLSPRSKVDVYHDFIYLVLHFPLSQMRLPNDQRPSGPDTQEVDFILAKDFIITTHYETINPLNDFAKIFESDFILKKSSGKIHTGFVFYYIIKEIYDSLSGGLDYINNRLKDIEDKVFSNREKEVIQDLSAVNRDLLDCRWALKNHGEILESLAVAGEDLFGEKFQYYLKAITSEHDKIWNSLESNQETFRDLRDTNESLLSIKSNETMRTLTVVAFIFLPINLISEIFSMRTSLPIVGQIYDFEKVLGIMLLASIVMYAWAKNRKWI